MNVRNLIVLAVVAFVLFFLISQPQQSATVVDNVLGALRSAAESIITFVSHLFGG